jgi:hypothetical protein
MAICETCGNQFTPDKPGRKYCRRSCYTKAQTGAVRLSIRKREDRACIVCGKVFEVGGRAKDRSQETCSIACGNLTRYRHGSATLVLIPTDAAYFAGIMDGEGSIMVLTKRDTCILKLSVSNTHRPLIAWLQEITGIGSIVTQRRASERHSECRYWQCYSEAAESLLKQILPYLRIKRAQADLALSVQERLRDPKLKADRVWQQEAVAQMQAMNKRGPKVAGG